MELSGKYMAIFPWPLLLVFSDPSWMKSVHANFAEQLECFGHIGPICLKSDSSRFSTSDQIQ